MALAALTASAAGLLAVSGAASAREAKPYEVVAYEARDNGTREKMLICGTNQHPGVPEFCVALQNMNWAWKKPHWLWQGTVKLIAFDPHGQTPPAAKIFKIDSTRAGAEYTVSWDELDDPPADMTIPAIAPSEGCREIDERFSLPENFEEPGYETANTQSENRSTETLASRLEKALPLCGNLLRTKPS